jgi:hypothetical protein
MNFSTLPPRIRYADQNWNHFCDTSSQLFTADDIYLYIRS